MIMREKRRGSHDNILLSGMWKAAAPVLFILDWIYPLVCRTLCDFFACRDLKAAGWYLEADYSVRCRGDERFDLWLPYVAAATVGYVFGIPAFFWFLVRKYKRRGQEGDKTVSGALGWPV